MDRDFVEVVEVPEKMV